MSFSFCNRRCYWYAEFAICNYMWSFFHKILKYCNSLTDFILCGWWLTSIICVCESESFYENYLAYLVAVFPSCYNSVWSFLEQGCTILSSMLYIYIIKQNNQKSRPALYQRWGGFSPYPTNTEVKHYLFSNLLVLMLNCCVITCPMSVN